MKWSAKTLFTFSQINSTKIFKLNIWSQQTLERSLHFPFEFHLVHLVHTWARNRHLSFENLIFWRNLVTKILALMFSLNFCGHSYYPVGEEEHCSGYLTLNALMTFLLLTAGNLLRGSPMGSDSLYI